MCLIKYHVLIICLLFYHTFALNCRSDGGPKDSELKNIYKKCLKMQDGKNSSSNRENSGDHEWKETRRNQGKRNDWERDQMGNDRERNRDNKRNTNRRGDDDRRGGSGDRMEGYDEKMGSYGDSMGNYDRMGRGYGNREDSMRNNEGRYGRDNVNGRNDFQHDDFSGDMSNQYGYQSSTQSSRRYRRDRRTENSGQRSQFNPNSSHKSGYDESYRDDDRNSGDNSTSKEELKKACALHCFLENLEMTAEDGMPDRYSVTHMLTKDVTNEDLKDFLQESIEECFQILDNENTDDKCEFSKDLLMCLSEKGRSNCDDWKDDLKF